MLKIMNLQQIHREWSCDDYNDSDNNRINNNNDNINSNKVQRFEQ